MKQHRTLTAAFAAALALTLAACGGEDEAEPTTPAPPAGTEDVAEETAGDVAEETAEQTAAPPDQDDAAATTDTEPEEEEPTTDAAADGEVPALEDILPTAMENAQDAEAVVARVTTPESDTLIHGRVDDSNYRIDTTDGPSTFSVIGDEGTHYFIGNVGYWRYTVSGSEEYAEDYADKWVIAPPTMGFDESMSLTRLWESSLEDFPTGPGQLQTSSAELSDLDGQEAYYYVLEDGSEFWVTTDTEPYPLGRTLDGQDLRYEAWNDDVEVVEPPDDAITVEELVSGG